MCATYGKQNNWGKNIKMLLIEGWNVRDLNLQQKPNEREKLSGSAAGISKSRGGA